MSRRTKSKTRAKSKPKRRIIRRKPAIRRTAPRRAAPRRVMMEPVYTPIPEVSAPVEQAIQVIEQAEQAPIEQVVQEIAQQEQVPVQEVIQNLTEPERRGYLPSALTAITGMLALGIPAAAAYALHEYYPNAVQQALHGFEAGQWLPLSEEQFAARMARHEQSQYGRAQQTPIPVDDFDFDQFQLYRSQMAHANDAEGDGIGGARRRRVVKKPKKPSRKISFEFDERKTPRSKSKRSKSTGAKRPLTKYQRFVKKHRKAGVTMAKVAAMWKKSKREKR